MSIRGGDFSAPYPWSPPKPREPPLVRERDDVAQALGAALRALLHHQEAEEARLPEGVLHGRSGDPCPRGDRVEVESAGAVLHHLVGDDTEHGKFAGREPGGERWRHRAARGEPAPTLYGYAAIRSPLGAASGKDGP